MSTRRKKTRISQDYDICWYSLISFRSKTKKGILGPALINTAMCFSKVECLKKKKKDLLGPDTCVLSCFSHILLFQSYGLQQARLLYPCDSPGKNTGVGAICFSMGPSQPRIKPASLMSPALTGEFFTTSTTWEARICGPSLNPDGTTAPPGVFRS